MVGQPCATSSFCLDDGTKQVLTGTVKHLLSISYRSNLSGEMHRPCTSLCTTACHKFPSHANWQPRPMRAGLQVSLSSSRPFNWGKNLSVQKSSARFFLSLSLNNHLILTRWWARFCTTEEKEKEKKNKSIVTQKLIAAQYMRAFLSFFFWSMRNRCQVSQFDSFKALIV